jgi:hypothetical protein
VTADLPSQNYSDEGETMARAASSNIDEGAPEVKKNNK